MIKGVKKSIIKGIVNIKGKTRSSKISSKGTKFGGRAERARCKDIEYVGAEYITFVLLCVVMLNLGNIGFNLCIMPPSMDSPIDSALSNNFIENNFKEMAAVSNMKIKNNGGIREGMRDRESASSEGNVHVMFDIGLGEVYWASVEYIDNMTAIEATEKAAEHLGIDLDVVNYSFGKFVNSIEGKYSKDWSWWWHFLIWNESMQSWEDSNVGASSYIISRNMTIGWAQVSNPEVTPENRDSWSSFRYKLGNTTSSIPNTMEIKYTVDLGRGPIDATPVYSDGMLYVLSGGKLNWSNMEYMEYERKGAISCIDAKNGEIIWEKEIESMYGYQLSSPCIYDGKIFFGSSAGGFYCYAKNGTLLWNLSCEPVTSSPICDEGRVFFASGNELYCYSIFGERYWNVSIGNVYSSSPVLYNGSVYIGTDDSGFYCINMSDGTIFWKADVKGKVRGTACVYEDNYYEDNYENNGINNGINKGGKIVFSTCVYSGYSGIEGELYCYSENGEKIWNVSIGPSVSSPVVRDNAIFLGTNSGLVCYSTRGERRFELPVGEVKSSPAISKDGLVVFSTNTANGSVYVVDNSGRIMRWRTLQPEQYLLSSPIICNGEIYQCSDNGLVYCFGDRLPVANFTFECVNEKNGKYKFNASLSSDESGELEYVWDFGDGNCTSGKVVEEVVEYEYKKNGSYNVTLKVIDDEGSVAECIKTIVVNIKAESKTETNESSKDGFSNDELMLFMVFVLVLVGVVAVFLSEVFWRKK